MVDAPPPGGDWFREWALYHQTVFGFGVQNADAFLEMLASWESVFRAAGYRPEELHEATQYLAAGTPPRFPGEHLGALTARIRARRAIAYRAEAEAVDDDLGVCAVCGGTGRVIVPNLKGIKDGEWMPLRHARGMASYYTYAVLCMCRTGQRVGERQGERLMLTLSQYERANSRWKIQLAQHERELAARARLGPRDRRMEATWARLREQHGIREEAGAEG